MFCSYPMNVYVRSEVRLCLNSVWFGDIHMEVSHVLMHAFIYFFIFSIWRVVSTHLSLRAEHWPNNGISVERSTFGNKVTKCFTEKKVTADKKTMKTTKELKNRMGKTEV